MAAELARQKIPETVGGEIDVNLQNAEL
jgi:hypothetical protein